MIRRAALAALAAAALAVPLGTAAQTPRRVGILLDAPPAASGSFLDAFRAELRERGWVEGKTIALDPRFPEGKQERIADLAVALVRAKVDVIVARTLGAAVAARSATTTIPIVLAAAGDPVRAGLAASLERPERNVSGVIHTGDDPWSKQLAVLKEIRPQMTKVGVLGNPGDPALQRWLGAVAEAAAALGIKPGLYAARTPEELDRAFAKMTSDQAHALLVVADPVTLRLRARIAELAVQAKLPSIAGAREYAEAGGLAASLSSELELYRRSAVYVDKILKGARPASLPIDQVPTTFELVVNMKAAKALDIALSPALTQGSEVLQ